MALDKVIDSAQLDADLTAVADAIRTKGGTTGKLEFPSGFVSAVEGIQAGGGVNDSFLLSILDRSVTEVNLSGLTSIGDYTFCGCTNLKNLILPDLTTVGTSVFQKCTALTELNLPNLQTAGLYAFKECKLLQSVNLPSLNKSSGSVFENCTSLKSLHLPALNDLPSYFCNSCSSLESIDLPIATRLQTNGFSNCKALKQISVPNVRVLAMQCFMGCGIESAIFPNLNTLDTKCFYNNAELKSLEFGSTGQNQKCSIFGTQDFVNCSKLNTLILRTSAIWTLANVNSFDGTPFASGGTGGTVYCPAALIEQYQQATNWSTLYAAGTCNFVAIEGSEYE